LLERSSKAFHRQFEAGDYHAAMETFRADSSLHDDEEALYRRGLLYALPSSPYYDPGRAREAYQELLERHPDTQHRLEADHLLGLLEEIQGLGNRVSQLRTRLEQLKAVDLDETPPDTGGVRSR
jgi:tetratricopeptide (TPR) repeat protein